MENEIKPEEPTKLPQEQAEADYQPDLNSEAEEVSDINPVPVNEEENKPAIHHRFRHWYLTHKRWAIPASVLLLVLLIALVPLTRYAVAGLALKKDASIIVKDSTTSTPVSGAAVSDGSASIRTDANGRATLRSLKVGHHNLTITKKYYKDRQIDLLVPVLSSKNIPSLGLVATGRQVKLKVSDFVNGGGLSNVVINVAGTDAKTDKNGDALIVVPAGSTNPLASFSLKGYNSYKVNLRVDDNTVILNNIKLVASGQVYFLSKLSGTIDVVKTNLDGSGRQTVIAGTGNEEDANTVLLASRDWKYLALLAKRDSSPPKLYVINTDDDKLITMDQGNSTFTPVGWYNHYFIYTIARNGFNSWQPNAFSIKSYNAETGQLPTLANSAATGTSNADAQYQNISNTLIMGDNVVYQTTWYKYPGYLQVPGQQNVLTSIHPDGTGSRQIKTVDAATNYISNLKLNKPEELYFGIYNNSSADNSYYVLDKSGNLTQNSAITDKDLITESKTYLASPSGRQTFWQEERDGKNTLFVGDQDAGSAKQIATLSDYNTYGWYSDDYLLVSKNSSELYIISKNGLSDNSKAIKISDYHKPNRSFYGYGGGYGGI